MKVYEVSPRSKRQLESSAINVLAEFDSALLRRRKPLNVEHLVEFYMHEKYEWSLDPHEALPAGVEGYCDPKTQTLVIPEATLHQLEEDGRSRFTVVHEYSHVEEHRAQMKSRMVEYDERSERLFRRDSSEIVAYKNPEWQANYLGGALLMPEEHILSIVAKERGVTDYGVQQIASIFKVSLSAARIRMNHVWSNHFGQKKGR